MSLVPLRPLLPSQLTAKPPSGRPETLGSNSLDGIAAVSTTGVPSGGAVGVEELRPKVARPAVARFPDPDSAVAREQCHIGAAVGERAFIQGLDGAAGQGVVEHLHVDVAALEPGDGETVVVQCGDGMKGRLAE